MKKVLPIIAVLAMFAAACSSSSDAGGVASLEDTEQVATEEDAAEATDE